MSIQKWRRSLEAWWEKLQSRWNTRRQKRNEKRMQKWNDERTVILLRQTDSAVSREVRPDFDLEVFKVVVEHFRHNLEIFWQHYVLFIVIQGALLTVSVIQNPM